MNKERGQVKVDIGGRVRVLHFSLNSLINIEDEFGKSLPEIFKELEGAVSIKLVRFMIYQGLVEDDKELTPEIVGSWTFSVKDIMDLVGEALNACMGEGEEGKKEPIKK